MTRVAGGGRGLAGLRVLVVEDDPLIAMEVEELLRAEGCDVVGPAYNVAGALALAERERLDAALLDVNLAGELVFPVAQALARRSVPFVFVTASGVGALDPAYTGHPIIAKPFAPDCFAAEVAAALEPDAA